jgi:hypothetical protein
MIYWSVISPEGLEKNKTAIRESEKEKLALEAKTMDQVAPGEQQPEIDHNIKSEKTNSGIIANKHWREAQGWFSYDLKNKANAGHILRITYFGLDKGRTFDIYVNGSILTTVNLDGAKGGVFFDVNYDIPQAIIDKTKDGIMNVKFIAHENSVAGGIYYVRLLK